MTFSDSSPATDKLDEHIARFLDAEQRGQPIDPEQWLQELPEQREQLLQFLQMHHSLQKNLPGSSSPDLPGEYPTVTFGPYAPSDSPAVPDLLPDYRVEEFLGKGGMGVVYKATQLKNLQRPRVALKIVRPGTCIDLFKREAMTIANMNHPNILKVYEFGECKGQFYFTMDLAHESLEQLLQRQLSQPGGMTRRELRENITRLERVSQAVHHVHGERIFHRDLKPQNVLLDKEGWPLVADFGLAAALGMRGLDGSTAGAAVGEIAGTPGYMPPEQARGDGVAAPSDVFALGGILYFMLCGRPPLVLANKHDIRPADRTAAYVELSRNCQIEYPQPANRRQHVDADLAYIALRALSKTPGDRYPSAEAFAADLNLWLKGYPVRPGWKQVVLKYCAREPFAALLYVVATLALVVGAVALGFWSQLTTVQTEHDQLRKDYQADKEAFDSSAQRVAQAYGDRDQAQQARDAANTRSELARAWELWRSGQRVEACKLLDSFEPEFQSWEWRWLQRYFQAHQVVLLGHTGSVNGVAVHPQGQFLASYGKDNSLRLWRFSTGEEVESLSGFLPNSLGIKAPGNISSAAFRPGSNELAYGVQLAGGFGTSLGAVCTYDVRLR